MSSVYIDKLFGLKGKTAIITGAAGQMGGEYCRTLLNAGAKVAGWDLNPDGKKGNLSKIKSKNFITCKVDITNRKSVEEGLRSVVRKFGSPNILVNNAAIDAPPNSSEQETGPFETYPEQSLDKMYEVNLKGTIVCCQVVGGFMAKKGSGSIINIGSLYGMRSPDQRIYEYREKLFIKPVSYSVTKGSIYILTKYLAAYWAKKNVRVNAVSPCGVFNNQDKTFLANYTKKVPMGRMASQDDFNGAIIYLSSDASLFVTGTNLVVDGGYSCW